MTAAELLALDERDRIEVESGQAAARRYRPADWAAAVPWGADPESGVRPERAPPPPGWSDPRNWVPIPDDCLGEPPAVVLGAEWAGWTWDELRRLEAAARHAAGGRLPLTELEGWVMTVARRAARRAVRRILKREFAFVRASLAAIEGRLSRAGL